MAEVFGTEGPDRLAGTTGDDTIRSLGGNDVIMGSAGRDNIDGGAGSDLVQFFFTQASGMGSEAGGGRYFTIDGDRAAGGRLRDASGRFDTSFVNVESLSISNTGPYDLTVDASRARNLAINVFGTDQQPGVQRVIGGEGNDRINVSRGLLVVDAGGGNDFVTVGLTGPIVATQSGNVLSLHRGGPDGAVVASVANAEQISLYSSNPTAGSIFDASSLTRDIDLQGTDANDILIGGSGDDVLQMRGRGFDFDTLIGGAGADEFYVISFDLLARSTRIGTFEGHDRLDFSIPATSDEAGASYIGRGAFTGQAGEYRMTINGRRTVIEIDANGDSISDASIVIGDQGLLFSETSLGSNILVVDTRSGLRLGTLYDDTLDGDATANFLIGQSGDDRLLGGGGNDMLEGGAGQDILRGGTGADVFLFDTSEDGTGNDRIVDFTDEDILVFTEELRDSNGDGRIDFGRNRVLDLLAFDGDDQGKVSITENNGRMITSLQFDGFTDIGGIRYFIYSRVGSAAGVETLTSSSFVDLLG